MTFSAIHPAIPPMMIAPIHPTPSTTTLHPSGAGNAQ
jgi:hypothetical protein